MMEISEWHMFLPSQFVVRQGQRGNLMYVLCYGAASIEVEGIHVCDMVRGETVGHRNFFGLGSEYGESLKTKDMVCHFRRLQAEQLEILIQEIPGETERFRRVRQQVREVAAEETKAYQHKVWDEKLKRRRMIGLRRHVETVRSTRGLPPPCSPLLELEKMHETEAVQNSEDEQSSDALVPRSAAASRRGSEVIGASAEWVSLESRNKHIASIRGSFLDVPEAGFQAAASRESVRHNSVLPLSIADSASSHHGSLSGPSSRQSTEGRTSQSFKVTAFLQRMKEKKVNRHSKRKKADSDSESSSNDSDTSESSTTYSSSAPSSRFGSNLSHTSSLASRESHSASRVASRRGSTIGEDSADLRRAMSMSKQDSIGSTGSRRGSVVLPQSAGKTMQGAGKSKTSRNRRLGGVTAILPGIAPSQMEAVVEEKPEDLMKSLADAFHEEERRKSFFRSRPATPDSDISDKSGGDVCPSQSMSSKELKRRGTKKLTGPFDRLPVMNPVVKVSITRSDGEKIDEGVEMKDEFGSMEQLFFAKMQELVEDKVLSKAERIEAAIVAHSERINLKKERAKVLRALHNGEWFGSDMDCAMADNKVGERETDRPDKALLRKFRQLTRPMSRDAVSTS
jgi:hypothetical protein